MAIWFQSGFFVQIDGKIALAGLPAHHASRMFLRMAHGRTGQQTGFGYRHAGGFRRRGAALRVGSLRSPPRRTYAIPAHVPANSASELFAPVSKIRGQSGNGTFPTNCPNLCDRVNISIPVCCRHRSTEPRLIFERPAGCGVCRHGHAGAHGTRYAWTEPEHTPEQLRLTRPGYPAAPAGHCPERP